MISFASYQVMAAVGIWQAIKDFFANSIEWLFQLTQSIGMPSYLLAIFLFTVIIKLLLQPMMNKQMRSSRKMQMLAPEVEELKRRYASNPQKQQQETMKLYKEHGASPTAGCLPMLIQMPILIALFDSLRTFGQGASVHPMFPEYFNFLCWDNLAELVKNAPYPWLLPIVAAAATFLQQLLTTPNIKDRQQQIMLFAFPLMFFFFVRSFPVLMAFYWIFYSLIGVVIMYPLLRRWKRIDTAELEAKRNAKVEEEEKRKAARKAAREQYYKGKPRKEQDKNGKRGSLDEADDEDEDELPDEELSQADAAAAEEKKFIAWLKQNDYIVTKKKMKLHPYSPEPTIVTLVIDEHGVEQDMDNLRQEYSASQRTEQMPTSLKEVWARRKQNSAPAAEPVDNSEPAEEAHPWEQAEDGPVIDVEPLEAAPENDPANDPANKED